MNTEVMFSSDKMDWATPQAFFDQLDSESHFTLDPCADETNHKCDRYFTVAEDGLKQPWGRGGTGETVFCNPPYGSTPNSGRVLSAGAVRGLSKGHAPIMAYYPLRQVSL